jgi:hypothetical protein
MIMNEFKVWVTSKARTFFEMKIDNANSVFNGLTSRKKTAALLIFGIAMGGVSVMLIIQALIGQENNKKISIESISTPKDIFVKEDTKANVADQLIPVGKFKGMMNGEFEALYLAVDYQGNSYINRSLDFSTDAYQKSKGWKLISRQDLAKYEKELHFIPARTKGIKHSH